MKYENKAEKSLDDSVEGTKEDREDQAKEKVSEEPGANGEEISKVGNYSKAVQKKKKKA